MSPTRLEKRSGGEVTTAGKTPTRPASARTRRKEATVGVGNQPTRPNTPSGNAESSHMGLPFATSTPNSLVKRKKSAEGSKADSASRALSETNRSTNWGHNLILYYRERSKRQKTRLDETSLNTSLTLERSQLVVSQIEGNPEFLAKFEPPSNFLDITQENELYRNWIFSTGRSLSRDQIQGIGQETQRIKLYGVFSDESADEEFLKIFYAKQTGSIFKTVYGSDENIAKGFEQDIKSILDEIETLQKRLKEELSKDPKKIIQEELERINSIENPRVKQALTHIINKISDSHHLESLPPPYARYILSQEFTLAREQLKILGSVGIRNIQQQDKAVDHLSVKHRNRALKQLSESYQVHQEAVSSCLVQVGSVLQKQITAVQNNALNIAIIRPALREFRSKFKNVEITESLSRDQLSALEKIDQVIFDNSHSQTLAITGKAEVRFPTGFGKSFLASIIEKKYKAQGIIGEIVNIDLNSSNTEITGLFTGGEITAIKQGQYLATATGTRQNKVINVDEAFFYGRFREIFCESPTSTKKYSQLTEDDFEHIETRRNMFLRQLRHNGNIVISWGASEAVGKVQIEYARNFLKSNEKYREFLEAKKKFFETKRLLGKFERIDLIEKELSVLFPSGFDTASFATSPFSGNIPQSLTDRGFVYERGRNNREILQEFIKIHGHFLFEEKWQEVYDSLTHQVGKTNKTVDSTAVYQQLFLAIEQKSATILQGSQEKTQEQVQEKLAQYQERSEEAFKEFERRQRLRDERKEFWQDLRKRRDTEVVAKITKSSYERKATTQASITSSCNGIFEGTKKRAQIIIQNQEFDYDLKFLQEIQQKSGAEIIVFPFLYRDKTNGHQELRIKIFSSQNGGEIDDNGEVGYVTNDPSAANGINQALEKHGFKDKKLISIFDKRNCVGGDYGHASSGIDSQLCFFDESATRNIAMQMLGRNRTPQESNHVCAVKIFSPLASKEEFSAEMATRTAEEDKAHILGYLNAKIGDVSVKSKKEIERDEEYRRSYQTNGNVDEIISRLEEEEARIRAQVDALDGPVFTETEMGAGFELISLDVKIELVSDFEEEEGQVRKQEEERQRELQAQQRREAEEQARREAEEHQRAEEQARREAEAQQKEAEAQRQRELQAQQKEAEAQRQQEADRQKELEAEQARLQLQKEEAQRQRELQAQQKEAEEQARLQRQKEEAQRQIELEVRQKEAEAQARREQEEAQRQKEADRQRQQQGKFDPEQLKGSFHAQVLYGLLESYSKDIPAEAQEDWQQIFITRRQEIVKQIFENQRQFGNEPRQDPENKEVYDKIHKETRDLGRDFTKENSQMIVKDLFRTFGFKFPEVPSTSPAPEGAQSLAASQTTTTAR